MTERVLVIDPGERVGWARVTIEDGKMLPETFAVGAHAYKPFCEALAGKTIVPAACGGEVEYDRLVWETWRLYASHAQKLIGSEMQSSQVVGVIRLCGWISGARLASLPAKAKDTGIVVMEPWLKAQRALCSEEHSKDACDLLSVYHYKTYVKPRGKR